MDINSYLFGLLGGLMIGSAGAILLLGTGRIMGASGILGRWLEAPFGAGSGEPIVFLAALIGAPGLAVLILGSEASTHLTTSIPVLICAGLLVGLGTRLANGCTSGHGVCGISRLSLRGVVATLFYLAAGVASVYVFKHILGVI